MEYRIASVIVDENGCIIEEGENIKATLDDGCVLCGTVESIFDREKKVVFYCEYFTVNIDIGRIVSITKE